MHDSHLIKAEIDLSAISQNYQFIQQLCQNSAVAAVVKADAYGLGLEQISQHLGRLGCQTFFVAHLTEAQHLRECMSDIEIYVLNGLVPGSEDQYQRFNLKPVLTSLMQIDAWLTYCETQAYFGKAAIHIDTGIHRLGFRLDELGEARHRIETHPEYFDLCMSHLACGDMLEDPRNNEQIQAFAAARRELSCVRRASIAATAGCFLGPHAYFDMVRPGIGLYGGNPFSDGQNPFFSAVAISARILQIKRHKADDFVGYGNAHRLAADTLVGTISYGYADGIPRRLTLHNESALSFVYHGHKLPVLGRISMDMTLVDMTNIAHLQPQIGNYIHICCPEQPLDELAKIYQSIPNEVLTSLSKRARRVYYVRENAASSHASRFLLNHAPEQPTLKIPA